MKKILFSSVCALALCGTSVFAEVGQSSSNSAPTQAPAEPFKFPWDTLRTGLDTAKTKAEADYKTALGTNAGTLISAVKDRKAELGVEAKGEVAATKLYLARDEAQKKLDDKIAAIGKAEDKSDTKVGGNGADKENLTLYADMKAKGETLIGKATDGSAPTEVAQATNLTDLLNIYKTGSTKDDTKAEAVQKAIKDIEAGVPVDFANGDIKTALEGATALVGKDAYNTAKQTLETAQGLVKPSKDGGTSSGNLADALAKAEKDITDKLKEIEKAEEALTAAENKTAESKKATAEYKALLNKQELFNEAAKAQEIVNNGTTAAEGALTKAKATLTAKTSAANEAQKALDAELKICNEAKAILGEKAVSGKDPKPATGLYLAQDNAQKAVDDMVAKLGDTNANGQKTTLYDTLKKQSTALVGTASSSTPATLDKVSNLKDLEAYYGTNGAGNNAETKGKVTALITKLNTLGTAVALTDEEKKLLVGTAINTTDYDSAEKAVADAKAKLGTNSDTKDKTTLYGQLAKAKDDVSVKDGEVSASKAKLGAEDAKDTTLYGKLNQAKEALEKAQADVTTAEKDLTKAKQAVADAKATLEKAALYTDDGIKAVASVKASLGEYASIAGDKANVLAAKFALVGSDISNADKEQQKEIQTVANEVAKTIVDNKKEEISSNALTSLAIQLNNMNKRLGEVRGMGGDTGVWTRVYGGKYSTDYDKFNYYSAQIGADKKSALKDGDLILGILAGYDKVNADIKTDAYSFGIYGSYIHNSGFFADSVMKFVSTSHNKSGWDIANQKSFLASLEGGYRFDASESFYVEPSLEFITGHVSEYSAKQAKTTTTVESFSPVIFKPQAFVGVNLDDLAFRFGGGYVLNAKKQEANIMIEDIVAGVNASASTKLEKNNHGFVSLGTSYKIGDNLRLNLSAERTFGGELQKDYEINTIVRYSF